MPPLPARRIALWWLVIAVLCLGLSWCAVSG
jgi:hypothetical protein